MSSEVETITPTVKTAARRCPRTNSGTAIRVVQTVIPMVANATSMSRRTVCRPGPARRPVLGGAAEVVETVQRGALEVDQEGQHHEERRAHPGPGQGDGAGAVEHGRQYAGRPGGQAHPQRALLMC